MTKPKQPRRHSAKTARIANDPSGSSDLFKRFPLWWPALVVVAFLAYWPALSGGFVWDDDAWTTQIEASLQDVNGLIRIWLSPRVLQQYYPLTGTTFWIDRRLWGTWTTPYHVENLVFHIASAWLFGRLLRELKVPQSRLAAAVFLLHPVMVESVGWIAERKNVLSLLLLLLAVCGYARWNGFWNKPFEKREARFYLWWNVFFVAAMLAKITAFCFPAIALLLCWWKTGRIRLREDLLPLLPSILFTVGLGLFIRHLEIDSVGAEGDDWNFTPAQRLLIAGRAICFYAGKLLWPFDLAPIYPRWSVDARALWQWTFPVSAVAFVGLLWLRRRTWGRGSITAALLFIVPLFPVLGVLDVYGQLYTFVADRWVHISSLGFIAGVSVAYGTFVARRTSADRGRLVALLLLGTLAVLTWRHSRQFQDMDTYLRSAISHNPDCWIAYANLGGEHAFHGRFEEAVVEYRRAIALRPNYEKAHANIAHALLQLGRFDEAIEHSTTAVRLRPSLSSAHYNLALALVSKPRLDAAESSFREAVRLSPEFAPAHKGLGWVLSETGRLSEAIEEFRLAARLDSSDIESKRNLCRALFKAGRIAELVDGYQSIINDHPDDPDAYNNLAWVLATCPDPNLRDGNRAVAAAQQAVRLSQSRSSAYFQTLSAAYARSDRFPEALAASRQALELANSSGLSQLLPSIEAARRAFVNSEAVTDESLRPRSQELTR